MARKSGAGSGAEPDTSSRAARRPGATAAPASASRWYIVGTPNAIVAPPSSAEASARGSNRPRWCSAPPSRSGPSRPSTSPCTWNSGSACVSVSSAVHSQAAASASRFEAIARRDSRTPFGGPVVPEV